MNALSLAAALIIGTVVLYYFFKTLVYILAYLLIIFIASLPFLLLYKAVKVGIEKGISMGSGIIYLSFFVSVGVWVLWLRSGIFKMIYEKIRPKQKVDDIYKIDITKLNKPPAEKK